MSCCLCWIALAVMMVVFKMIRVFSTVFLSQRSQITLDHMRNQSGVMVVHITSQVVCRIMALKSEYSQYDPITNTLIPCAQNQLKQCLREIRQQKKSDHPVFLLQSNHISIIDVFLIGGLIPTSFLAKEELKSWPIIGRMCAWSGIEFVNREDVHDRVRAIFCVKKNSHRCLSVSFQKPPPPLISLHSWICGNLVIYMP